MPQLFFHGSKADFEIFKPEFIGTGEGTPCEFRGWFFVDTAWGAAWHIRANLRHLDGDGFLYVCEIPDNVIYQDCEKGFTDVSYGSDSVGVLPEYSNKIRILTKIPFSRLLFSSIEKHKEYSIDDLKSLVKGPS